MSVISGVKRRVEFRAECARDQWTGPWRDRKWHAAEDLVLHELDEHGGQQRGDA